MAAAYRPILLSKDDSAETVQQVIEHNNVYWCAHAAERPDGFDATVCDD